MNTIKRHASAFVVAALSASAAFAGETKSKPEDVAKLIPQETEAQYNARMAWWIHDRFGMFIHFGLYAAPARHEWVKKNEKIDDETYGKYFPDFNPDLFDAKAWAKQAKAAGMRYCVLTTKHHEGFCLFDSKFTDYKITKTPFGRDLVREYVDAFRAEGIKVGFYYSVIDWHHPDFTIDTHHPERPGDPKFWPDPRVTPADFEKANAGRDMAKYRAYMKDQVREILSNYGKIDIAWFDFSYPGEHGKGRDDWDSKGLLEIARTLQPGIIVDNRLDLDDVPGGWDFMTPEQFQVPEWPRRNGVRVPWETCQTFGGAWGYYRYPQEWKDDAQLVTLLADTVSKGGNLLLNVGPTARGEIEPAAKARLEAMGRWLRVNGRAIYGCTAAPEGILPPPDSVLTYNPETKRLYAILKAYPNRDLACPFADRVDFVRLQDTGVDVEVRKPKTMGNFGEVEIPEQFILPKGRPASALPVLEITLKD